jgi:hypothetical protein
MAVASLPFTVIYEQAECPICLVEIPTDDNNIINPVITLSCCGNKMHKECSVTYFPKDSRCPFCRHDHIIHKNQNDTQVTQNPVLIQNITHITSIDNSHIVNICNCKESYKDCCECIYTWRKLSFAVFGIVFIFGFIGVLAYCFLTKR